MSEDLKWLDDQQMRDELSIVETMFSAKGKVQLSKICAEAQKYVAVWELFKIKLQDETDKARSVYMGYGENKVPYMSFTELTEIIHDIEKRVSL